MADRRAVQLAGPVRAHLLQRDHGARLRRRAELPLHALQARRGGEVRRGHPARGGEGDLHAEAVEK